MGKNKILIIILALLLIALFIINRIKDPTEKRITFFKVDQETLHTIEFASKSDTLRFSRTDEEWVMEQPFFFPADNERIANFLSQFLPAETSKIPVSVSDESHNEYLVTKERGIMVSFYDAQEKLIDQAIVGRKGRLAFVKRPDENKVYQLIGHVALMVSTNTNAWRESSVVSIPRSRIKSVNVQYELNTYTISATDSLWHYEDAKNSFPVIDTNTQLQRLFTELEMLGSMRFLDNKFDEYEALFKKPSMVITITQINNKETVLTFSYDKEEENFIVMKDGNEEHMFLVDANIGDNFSKAYQHYQSK